MKYKRYYKSKAGNRKEQNKEIEANKKKRTWNVRWKLQRKESKTDKRDVERCLLWYGAV
jgi:hypothetical protein